MRDGLILLIMAMIATLVCSFVFSKDRYGDIQFGMFLLILISGIAGSLFICIPLYAFGSLVEDTNSIYSILLSNQRNQARDTVTTPQTDISNSNFRLSSVSEKGFKLSSVSSEEGWHCSKCGTFNKPTARVCEYCGKQRKF